MKDGFLRCHDWGATRVKYLNGIPWNFHGVPRSCMEYPWSIHGVPWNAMEFYGASMEFHGVFMEFHGMPCSSM